PLSLYCSGFASAHAGFCRKHSCLPKDMFLPNFRLEIWKLVRGNCLKTFQFTELTSHAAKQQGEEKSVHTFSHLPSKEV
ncbi:MAG: hypothetical protein IJU50_11395, partial [Lachnospiraceae bacterium]|nr:hypothetical protein [Lachnospiraceae bacterium]